MKKKYIALILLAVALSLILFYFTGEKEEGPISEIPSESEKDRDSIEDESVVDIDEEDLEEEAEEKGTDIAVDEISPNFTLENLKGEEISLNDYRGKYVLINFWATWCKYCDKEMPDLQKLEDENDDLVVLAVNVNEKRDLAREYIEGGGYDFEVVLDEKGEIARMYLVNAFPTSYFVDKEGILLGAIPGMMTFAQMTQVLESIREVE